MNFAWWPEKLPNVGQEVFIQFTLGVWLIGFLLYNE